MPVVTLANCIGMDTFQTYLNNKLDGTPLAAGKVYFYSQTDGSTLKNVYALTKTPPYTSLFAIPNPNTLNSDGTLSDGTGGRVIPYFYPFDANGDAELYQIQINDSQGTPQDTLYQMPPNSVNLTPTDINTVVNYLSNPEFLIWDHEPVLYGNGSPLSGRTIITTHAVADALEQICDGWYFQRNSSTTIDNFSQQSFSIGQAIVPGNPRYYLQYQCTSASGETYKRLIADSFQQNVNFLQGQSITISFWAKADATRNINFKWYQNFGTGGSSAALSANLASVSIGTTWTQYTVTFTVPSTLGNSAPAEDDYCYVTFELDINEACTYSFAKMFLSSGILTNVQFDSLTYAEYKAAMKPLWQIATGTYQFRAAGNAASAQNYLWLLMTDGITLGNGASGASNLGLQYFNLYVYFYTTYGNSICPVSTGRGTDAIADWNAGKTLTIPITGARLLGNSGAGSGLTTRAAGATGGSEQALIDHNHALGGHVAAIDKAWTNVQNGGPVPGSDGVATTPVGGSPWTLVDITTTEGSSVVTADSMNPFTFLQLYVHL